MSKLLQQQLPASGAVDAAYQRYGIFHHASYAIMNWPKPGSLASDQRHMIPSKTMPHTLRELSDLLSHMFSSVRGAPNVLSIAVQRNKLGATFALLSTVLVSVLVRLAGGLLLWLWCMTRHAHDVVEMPPCRCMAAMHGDRAG